MTRKFGRYLLFFMLLPTILGVPVLVMAAQENASTQAAAPEAAKAAPAADSTSARFIAIALMVTGAVLGASYAVGRIGAAVIGALSEKPELFGRSIIFIGLAEGLAIYGLLMGLLLLLMK
jgi:V/A-type H+-transporting ATPase subunit K